MKPAFCGEFRGLPDAALLATYLEPSGSSRGRWHDASGFPHKDGHAHGIKATSPWEVH